MIHMACFVYGLHRFVEEVRSQFSVVDKHFKGEKNCTKAPIV